MFEDQEINSVVCTIKLFFKTIKNLNAHLNFKN